MTFSHTSGSVGVGSSVFENTLSMCLCLCPLQAKAEMNEKVLDNGKTLYVGRAQKKGEREAELRARFAKIKEARRNTFSGVNLYIKNLDDAIDDEKLREEFAQYGSITSAKVR